jgi:hypothetical protein
MTEEKTYTWIKDATYTTRDGMKAVCIRSWEDGMACFKNPATDGAWIVDEDGRSVLRLGWADIVDGPEATAEDIEGPVQEPHRLEMILESKLAWNDGYREAIRYSLDIVVGHVDNRRLAAMLTRRLLIGYEHPMADPPF